MTRQEEVAVVPLVRPLLLAAPVLALIRATGLLEFTATFRRRADVRYLCGVVGAAARRAVFGTALTYATC